MFHLFKMNNNFNILKYTSDNIKVIFNRLIVDQFFLQLYLFILKYKLIIQSLNKKHKTVKIFFA